MKYKNISKNNTNVLLVGTITILMLSICISAFSVAFGGGVLIEPGQTVEYSFAIINTGEAAEDLTVEATIMEGAEYVSLSKGTTFNIPAGERGVVPVKVSVPANTKEGDTFQAKINFNTLEGGSIGGGTLSYKIAHTVTFDINVVDKIPTHAQPQNQTPPPVVTPQTTEGGSNVWLWVLAIVAIIIIVWIILKKKK